MLGTGGHGLRAAEVDVVLHRTHFHNNENVYDKYWTNGFVRADSIHYMMKDDFVFGSLNEIM